MKTESTINPSCQFTIEKLSKERCLIYFYANIIQETRKRENEEEQIIYVYDMYKIEQWYRDNLQEDIENDYETWFNYAKQQEYDKLAKEIREKRDELLSETDKEMCLDRAELQIPEGSTFSSWLVFLKSLANLVTNKMAEYRQALRDIPQQKEFPYNVIWPENPNNKDKEV